MPAKERLLVHPKPGELPQLTALQSASHRTLRDFPGRFPTHLQTPRYCRHRRILQPIDHQPLEEQRKLRPRLRPRHSNLHDPVLCARHPRHARVKPSLKLARVQVPPLSLPVIVDRRALSALRALRLGAFLPFQPHVNRLLLRIELDPLDLPRLAQAQNRPVQLPVSHRSVSPRDRTPSPLPSSTHMRSGRTEYSLNSPRCLSP